MEEIIQMEVEEIAEKIIAYDGSPISTRHMFNIASLNILWAITTGKRYHHSDEQLLRLLVVLTRSVNGSQHNLLQGEQREITLFSISQSY
jgi:hypothetical protein